MDFTILHFAIHIVWRANVICTCRKSGIARKTTVAYPELRLIDKPVEVRYNGDKCFGEIYAEPILYVPYGTKALYQIHEQWSGFKEIIEMDPTGISVILDDDCNASSNYSINGMKTSNTYKGLNIIRMNNGKTRKVMK